MQFNSSNIIFALFLFFVAKINSQSHHFNLTDLNGLIYFNVPRQPYIRTLGRPLSIYSWSWNITPPSEAKDFVLVLRLVYIRRYEKESSNKIIFPDGSLLPSKKYDLSETVICKMFSISPITSTCIQEVKKQDKCPDVNITTSIKPLVLKAFAPPWMHKKYPNPNKPYYYYKFDMGFIGVYRLHICSQSLQNQHSEMLQNNQTKYVTIIASLCVVVLICGVFIGTLGVLLRRSKRNAQLSLQESEPQQNQDENLTEYTYAEVNRKIKATKTPRADDASASRYANDSSLYSNGEGEVVANIIYQGFEGNSQ